MLTDMRWEAVRWKPGPPVIIAHYCPFQASALQWWFAFIAHPDHYHFFFMQIFHAVFRFASKHVFCNTWLLHATHVALYGFKTKIYWGKHLIMAIMLSKYDMDLVIHLTRWREFKRGTRCHFPFIACNSPVQCSIQKCGWHVSSTVR